MRRGRVVRVVHLEPSWMTGPEPEEVTEAPAEEQAPVLPPVISGRGELR